MPSEFIKKDGGGSGGGGGETTTLYKATTTSSDIVISEDINQWDSEDGDVVLSISNLVINSVDDLLEVNFRCRASSSSSGDELFLSLEFDGGTQQLLGRYDTDGNLSANMNRNFTASELGLSAGTYTTVNLLGYSTSTFTIEGTRAGSNAATPVEQEFSIKVTDKS